MPKQMASQSRFYKNWQSTRGAMSPSANTIAIRKLQRQVAKNTQEKIYFRNNSTIVPPLVGISNYTIPITDFFVNNSVYRDDILGDTFRNLAFSINFLFPSGYDQVRMVLYRPLKAGAALPITNVTADFTTQWDPKQFHIYSDRAFNPKNDVSSRMPKLNLSLRGLLTKYNSANSVLESGELKMLILHEGSTSPFTFGYKHTIQNK
jgi:hypothetical protein